jgi:CO/xanthine dehydrogenase Mo-binding subunit
MRSMTDDCVFEPSFGPEAWGNRYVGAAAVRAGVEKNFRDYPMIHIADAPAITTAFLRSDAQLGGLGEPGVPPLAPALANAIHAATGIRVRELPIKNTSLKSA